MRRVLDAVDVGSREHRRGPWSWHLGTGPRSASVRPCGPRSRWARRPCAGGAARRSRPTRRTARPPCGEAEHQHGADREVRGLEHPGAVTSRSSKVLRTRARFLSLGSSHGADDRGCRGGCRSFRLRDGRVRDTVMTAATACVRRARGLEVVVYVVRAAAQVLDPGGLLDRTADLAAHPAAVPMTAPAVRRLEDPSSAGVQLPVRDLGPRLGVEPAGSKGCPADGKGATASIATGNDTLRGQVRAEEMVVRRRTGDDGPHRARSGAVRTPAAKPRGRRPAVTSPIRVRAPRPARRTPRRPARPCRAATSASRCPPGRGPGRRAAGPVRRTAPPRRWMPCAASRMSSARTTRSTSSALGGGAAGDTADQAGVGIVRGEGVDRVGQPALLADLLEQPAAHAAAQGGVQDCHREATLVGRGSKPCIPSTRLTCSKGPVTATVRPAVTGTRRPPGGAGTGGRRRPGSRPREPCGRPADHRVLEVASNRDDHVRRRVTRPVVALHLGPGQRPDRRRGARDRTSQRRGPPRLLGIEVAHHVIRVVVVHRDLVEDHLTLGLDVRWGDRRGRDHVAEDVHRERQVLVEHPSVEAGVLLGGEGVELAADLVQLHGDVQGRAPYGVPTGGRGAAGATRLPPPGGGRALASVRSDQPGRGVRCLWPPLLRRGVWSGRGFSGVAGGPP